MKWSRATPQVAVGVPSNGTKIPAAASHAKYKNSLRATSFHHTTIATGQLSGEQTLCACCQMNGQFDAGTLALLCAVTKILIREQGCVHVHYQIPKKTYMHTAYRSRYL